MLAVLKTNIDDKTKAVTSGFIRAEFKSDISISIIQICALYLWCIESFAYCSLNLQISSDRYSVKKWSNARTWNNISCGQICIKSISTKLAIWTFKVQKICKFNKHFYGFMFYLCSGFGLHQLHYKLNVDHAWILSLRNKFNFNNEQEPIQVIKVILNTFNKTVCLSINNYTHCVCNNFVQHSNINYRIGVSILDKEQAIKLINFECKKINQF